MSLLNEHIIVEAYAERGLYQLRTLPTKGNLLLNGEIMKVGQRFTHEDVGAGRFQYQNTKVDLKAEIMSDSFKYVVPISETEILTAETPRSTCLPPANIPEDGVFTFGITILCIPFPKEIINKKITIMEDETLCFSRAHLFYSSDSEEIKRFDQDPAIYAPSPENQNFAYWKRFAGDRVYDLGQTIPQSDPAYYWMHDPELGNRGMLLTRNSEEMTGAVGWLTADRFSFSSVMSSTAKDDDMIFMIAAYVEIDGKPNFIGVGRSGGLNSNGGNLGNPSWFIFNYNGSTWSTVVDGSSRAPNHHNNTKNESWPSLGETAVEIIRKGNTLTARCSQFGSTELDDSTLLTYTLSGPFAGQSQYGFGALSQNNARLTNLNFKVLPPEGEEPTDPRADPLFERFPITYTIEHVDKGSEKFPARAIYKLNGAPMKEGDTFTHSDLDEGKVCIEGQFIGPDELVSFFFNACANVNKCTWGRFDVKVREWPYPEVVNNTASMNECEEITLTEDNLKHTVEFGSNPDQITYTWNIEKTLEFTNGNPHIEVVPPQFTQADVNAGRVKLVHHCEEDKTPIWEHVMFDVCTQKNKCVLGDLIVRVHLKPIEHPPVDDNYNVIPLTGCSYVMGFDGQWQLKGKCGLFAEIEGRTLPEPEEEGEIIHVPNAEQPVTVVAVKRDGVLTWEILPFIIDMPPEGTCQVVTSVPNIKTNVNVIYAKITGWEYDGVPEFALIVDNKRLEKKSFDGLKADQVGSKQFIFTYEGTLGPNTTIGIVQTNYKVKGASRRFIRVDSIEVNGSQLKDFIYYNDKNTKINQPASYGEIVANNYSVRVGKPTVGWDAPPPTGDPRTCYRTPNGTFISDAAGQLAPEKGTWDGKLDPIIKEYDFLPAIENTREEWPWPPPRVVFDKESNNVWVKQPDETYIPQPNPHTEAYNVDPFTWIGPNEFWMPFKQKFTIKFYTNRLYVRIDIMNTIGTKVYSRFDPFVSPGKERTSWLLTAPKCLISQRDPNGTTYTTSILKAMNADANCGRGNLFLTSPMDNVEDAMFTNQYFKPTSTDPYQLGNYIVQFPGTDYYGAFAAASRPKLTPEYMNWELFNNDKIRKPKSTKIWDEYDSVGYVSGNVDRRVRNPLRDSTVVPMAGAQYGVLDIRKHMDEWKFFFQTGEKDENMQPISKAADAWFQGELTFLSPDMVNNAREKRNGGTINTTPPEGPTTITFQARAYDIYTGEEKIRTFKIHYTETGKSPEGAKSKTTDALSSVGKSFLPPRGGTMICVYKDARTIGECTILPPSTPDPNEPPKTPKPW